MNKSIIILSHKRPLLITSPPLHDSSRFRCRARTCLENHAKLRQASHNDFDVGAVVLLVCGNELLANLVELNDIVKAAMSEATKGGGLDYRI